MRLAVAFALLLLPVASQAQVARPGPPAPATTAAPAPTSRSAAPASAARVAQAMTPFQVAIQRGAEAYHNRQYDAAGAAFREAATQNPRSPIPQLYLGYVGRSQNESANALGAFREAARIAQAEGDDGARARALSAIASIHESQARWVEARSAWVEYSAFADAHLALTYPTVGRARAEAIGRRDAAEREAAPVRERIAERLRANAAGQNPQAPAAAPR